MGQPSSSVSLQSAPQYVLEDIVNRLEDARDIARVQLACKDFRNAGDRVRSLRFIVLDVDHERARSIDVRSSRLGIPGKTNGEGSSTSQDMQHGESVLKLKEQLVKILERKQCLVQLRVEVESKLQAKAVLEDERRRTDFWLYDPWFVRQWVSQVGVNLQRLCTVDYGQQAIMRRSSIMKILSENCKRLKTLDLRNMFIDTSDYKQMPLMSSLILRMAKVPGEALKDINTIMPNLRALALLGVVGVERGILTFQHMKVLFLGLCSPAKDIEMNLPKLEKLQFKMQFPERLIITASILKYVAFNLDGLGPRQCQENDGSIKILYGASSYIALISYAEKIPDIERILLSSSCTAFGEDGRFLGTLKDVPNEILDSACIGHTLDVPCMKLLRDGRYLDLLNDTTVIIPSFSHLHGCGHQEVSNTPPGLCCQWRGKIPVGLNLDMNASAAA